MLKKAKLSIIIAASILSSNLSFAGNDVQVPQEIHKTIIETPDKLHNVKKTANLKSYDVEMNTITFRADEKIGNVVDNFLKIDADLRKTNNIDKTFQSYGKIVDVRHQINTVLSGDLASFSNTKSIEYVNEVTNGKQSKDFIDIINFQRFYINNLREDKKLTVLLNIQDSQLNSMRKTDIGEGSQKTYIESPSVSTTTVDQSVTVKPGEYKLVNMEKDQMTDPNPLSDKAENKLYKAIIIKVSEHVY